MPNSWDLTSSQKAVAQRIIDIGVQLGASQRDIAIALTTARQESDLRNDPTPDGFGSVGIYQDRVRDAPNGADTGKGSKAQVLADGGARSIYNFYLGGSNKGSGEGLNAGLLANQNRDQQAWDLAAFKTQGYAAHRYYPKSTHDYSPYYREDSENGQFAQAVLAGQVDGINPSAVQGQPQTGGVLYDRLNVGNVNDKRSVQAPVPNRPPTIWDNPSTWQGLVQANNPAPRPRTTIDDPAALPTITSEKTAISNQRPVAPVAAAQNPYGALPGPKIVQRIEAAPGQAAIALGHGLAGIGQDFVNKGPINALEHVGGGIVSGAKAVGHAFSPVKHALGTFFKEDTAPPAPAPAVAHGGGGGGGATSHTTDTADGFTGVTSERQAERAAQSFLPEVSHGDFHAGGTPQLNGLVPTDRSPGLEAAGVTPNNLRDAIVMQAQKWTGLDYVWGGKNKDTAGGLDCSGLVMSIMRAVGVDMGNPDEMNAAALGEAGGKINISDLQPGDMVAWDEGNSWNKNGAGADHIAFYIGNGYIAEAPRTGVKSRIRKLGEDFDKKNRIWGVDMSAKLGKGTVPPDHIPNHEVRPQEMIPEKVLKDIGHLATGALHLAEKIPGIGGGIKTAADTANHALHAVGDPAAAFTHDSEQALGGAIRGVVGTGAGAAEKAASLIGHAGVDVGQGVVGAVGSALGHEKDAVGGLISHPLGAAHDAWNSTGGEVLHAANTVVHHPLQALRGVGTELFQDPESFKVGRRVVGSVTPGLANVAAKGIEHVGGELLNTGPGQWAEHHVLDPVGHAIGNTVDALVNTPAHLAAKVVGAVPGGDALVHGAEAVGHALAFYKHGDSAAPAEPVGPMNPGGVPEATRQRLSAEEADRGLQNRANDITGMDRSLSPNYTTDTRADTDDGIHGQLPQQAEADRGLQNRANDIYAQQHPGTVYHPAAVAGAGYQGTTNIRQLEMAAPMGYRPGMVPLPSQLAGYVSTPAGNYQGNTTGFSDARDASQARAPGTLTAAQSAAMMAGVQASQQAMAQINASNAAISAQGAAATNAYYAQHAPGAPTAGARPVAVPAYTPMARPTPVGQAASYQANSMARSGTPIAAPLGGYVSAPYSGVGGYGVSTPSTQAMSTGLDRYADSRDSYYSPTGGGGTSNAAVATQMYGWSDARDAYVANQQKAQRQAAADADKGLLNAATSGAHAF